MSRRRLSSALTALTLATLCALGGCAAPDAGGGSGDQGAGAATATGSDTATGSATPTLPTTPWTQPFTIRGRWHDPRDIRWRVEPTPLPGLDKPPVEAAAFSAAVSRAAAVWNATGLVHLRPAREGERVDVTLGWRRGAHDRCPAFGRSPSVAHSGPVESGTFVHLDAARSWDVASSGAAAVDAASSSNESLAQVLAHEWGHVLGLDHVADSAALMSPDARVTTPGAGDLAGLQSLYGGGRCGPGDLHIGSAAGAGSDMGSGMAGTDTMTLRRIAPSDRTVVGLFDTDGDGASELLVVRTDPRGVGALTIYRFAAGPVLSATAGPFPGVAPAGMATVFARAADGSRWIVTRGVGGDLDGVVLRLRRFDDAGHLVEPSPQEVMALDVAALTDARCTLADVDGDGDLEQLRPCRCLAAPGSS